MKSSQSFILNFANHSICDLFYVRRLLVLHMYPEGTQRFMFFLNGKNPGGQTLKETGQQLVFPQFSLQLVPGGGGGGDHILTSPTYAHKDILRLNIKNKDH
jgi:hypothetical protein